MNQKERRKIRILSISMHREKDKLKHSAVAVLSPHKESESERVIEVDHKQKQYHNTLIQISVIEHH